MSKLFGWSPVATSAALLANLVASTVNCADVVTFDLNSFEETL